jgi:hypothetical protein
MAAKRATKVGGRVVNVKRSEVSVAEARMGRLYVCEREGLKGKRAR